MALVAKEAALAKGTLYLYFPTKEELFLAMVEEQLLGWFEELDESLAKGRGEMQGKALSHLLAHSLASRSQLPRLLAILHTVIERNIEHLTALRFKQFLATRMVRTGRLLERRLPFLEAGQGPLLLLRIHALALGLWQLADPAPVVKELLDAPGLHLFRVDFTEAMESALVDLLAGMKSAAAVPVSPTSGSEG
jgi:AcrR family transcriptional regulator